MKQVEIHWHGHACFEVIWDGFTVVFDPYADNYLPGLPPLDVSAHLVLCSHGHGDHNAAHVVKPLEERDCPFRVTALETFHDPEEGRLRGKNTVYLLEDENFRLAHFGDLGCTLTKKQSKALSGLDVAMIPVGGFYTIGPQEAKKLVETLQPKTAIPMHYRMGERGLPAVAEVDDFLSLVEPVMVCDGNTLTLTPDTLPEKPQVTVLTFEG